MRSLPRLLAPLSIAAAFAVAAPAAQAELPASSVSCPGVNGHGGVSDITDADHSANTVHLTVTPDFPADLERTKVFLGGNATTLPYEAVDTAGVHEADYGQDRELDTMCSLYGGELISPDPAVVVDADGESFSVDLPKGEVIVSDDVGVMAGIDDVDTGDDNCSFEGIAGLEVNYGDDHQVIGGFDWVDPPAFEVAASGGPGLVELVFDQEWGTDYDIYRVVGGVREDTPFSANHRGDGNDVHVVLTESDLHEQIAPGTAYTFQVEAVRRFFVFDEAHPDVDYAYRTFSAEVTASSAAFQTLQFLSAPPATTTDRNAQFTWSISNNNASDAPWCVLDDPRTPGAQHSEGTEVPCTATGMSFTGLSLGAHTLTVYPAYGDQHYIHAWTVTAVPPAAAPPVTPTTPTTPTVKTDPDGDGIKNTWLIGGKPAPAPGTPKASVVDGDVKLKLKPAPKGAKKIRVYRADGKGGYKLVKTLAPKRKSFTDTKVKPGHTYKYKTVGVNAKGQQGKASETATAKVKKQP